MTVSFQISLLAHQFAASFQSYINLAPTLPLIYSFLIAPIVSRDTFSALRDPLVLQPKLQFKSYFHFQS